MMRKWSLEIGSSLGLYWMMEPWCKASVWSIGWLNALARVVSSSQNTLSLNSLIQSHQGCEHLRLTLQQEAPQWLPNGGKIRHQQAQEVLEHTILANSNFQVINKSMSTKKTSAFSIL